MLLKSQNIFRIYIKNKVANCKEDVCYSNLKFSAGGRK